MTAGSLPSWLIPIALLFALSTSSPAGEKPVDYLRDIRPILAGKCFKCHGPDADSREADLRLDTPEGLFASRDGVVAVVAGQPQQSQLYQRVSAADPDQRMPPPEAKLELSAGQIEKLKQWIAQGAPVEKHWAFSAVVRPTPPAVENSQWVRNDIDWFILARLERAGLQPSSQADRYTLVRRLYLDLIGLPPSVEQADAFVNDRRSDAYQRLVESLLDSPHYGEHWARKWLDLARYADTNGYEKDRPRSMWPYRDWIIEAINRDMPFDRFTLEQIAGDMLPEATRSQKIASGFHRNTMLNEEGGVDVEQFRFESLVDRVATTGTVWLGLTLGCAQCHTHKYDPVSQKEYYQLFAFFNNSNELELVVRDAKIARQRAALGNQIAALTSDLPNHWPLPEGASAGKRGELLAARFDQWQQETKKNIVRWRVLTPLSLTAANRTTLTVLEDRSVLASGDRPNNDTYAIEVEPARQNITAFKLEVLPHRSLPTGGPGRASFTSGGGEKGDFLLSEFEVAVVANGDAKKAVPVAIAAASHSYALEKRSAALAVDGVFDTGWSIGGGVGKPHDAVFQLEEPLSLPLGARLRITLAQQYIHEMTIGRFRLSATTAPRKEITSSGVPWGIERILLTPKRKRTTTQQARLKQHFLLTAPELAPQHEKIAALRNQMPEHPTSLVMQQRLPQHARTTHVHQRGEYFNPTEAVAADVPAFLPPLGEDQPRDRLALGRWLASAENPLVGRVVMNRQWQAFFGRGIVRTTEDFGTQGAAPTHAELLDYLAVELVASGWSRKAMHRLIVNSATYQQSSRVTPLMRERDPDNLLLARGPRVRVDAEMVRDIALTASGQLARKVGGPSVFPPQPADVTALSYGNLKWETSAGDDRYRRGLYTFAKRTSPYAMFGLFDGPSGETCVVRRGRSNTPLQALTMLNDAVLIEAERHLARLMLTGGPASKHQRLTEIFRRYLTRPPEADEIELIGRFYDRQIERLRTGELDAAKILGLSSDDQPGNDKDDAAEKIDLNQWAALTLVARAVFNFDETITKE